MNDGGGLASVEQVKFNCSPSLYVGDGGFRAIAVRLEGSEILFSMSQLWVSISNGFVSPKIYDKRAD